MLFPSGDALVALLVLHPASGWPCIHPLLPCCILRSSLCTDAVSNPTRRLTRSVEKHCTQLGRDAPSLGRHLRGLLPAVPAAGATRGRCGSRVPAGDPAHGGMRRSVLCLCFFVASPAPTSATFFVRFAVPGSRGRRARRGVCCVPGRELVGAPSTRGLPSRRRGSSLFSVSSLSSFPVLLATYALSSLFPLPTRVPFI